MQLVSPTQARTQAQQHAEEAKRAHNLQQHATLMPTPDSRPDERQILLSASI
jgi:hypothetical protein